MLEKFNLKFFKKCEPNKSYPWSIIEDKKQDIYLLEQDDTYAKLLIISPLKEMALVTFNKTNNKFVESKYYSPDED